MMRSAKTMLVGALCGVMALSGCSVRAVQQTPPESVDDCRDYWKVERGAAPVKVAEGTNAFDAFVLRLLSGTARQTTSTAAANQRYRQCLTQFGVTNADDFESAASQGDPTAPYLQRLPPKRPVGCPPGVSVMYGGSGYCVGRRF